MKKRSGSVADILSTLLVILAAAIVMSAFLSIMRLASIHEEVKQLARKYMLEMETVGYLSAGSCTQLEHQLMDIGVINIDFNGTSFDEVTYGAPISLNISCTIPYERLNMQGDLMEFFFEGAEYDITVSKMSTAKH